MIDAIKKFFSKESEELDLTPDPQDVAVNKETYANLRALNAELRSMPQDEDQMNPMSDFLSEEEYLNRLRKEGGGF